MGDAMIPISMIKEGDMFSNPLFVRMNPPGVIWRVEAINVKEEMVLVQAYSGSNMDAMKNSRVWKKNTDRMFSETWRYA